MSELEYKSFEERKKERQYLISLSAQSEFFADAYVRHPSRWENCHVHIPQTYDCHLNFVEYDDHPGYWVSMVGVKVIPVTTPCFPYMPNWAVKMISFFTRAI